MDKDVEREIAALRSDIKELRDFVSALYGMIAEDEEDWDDGPFRMTNT